MKIIFQAVLGSLLIHVAYYVSLFLISSIEPSSNMPEIAEQYTSIAYLETQVAFGVIYSPGSFVWTFLAVTAICAIILFAYKKWFKKQKLSR
ncbi:hypothetical protein [Alkalihalobacillus trypoxylicola]|uniref:Uncharacterized protein n=1 Tax=Alkalihalobacillus trypoxylicola TaxID=519424 RepID=A0A162DG08_9BACI|nr:hypothetical protein [Alkalihalobacillus trypoxylicola]KYG29506.1 hypothetical protein AZF04_08275 [Alkalihalobacillus trypoxylicola]